MAHELCAGTSEVLKQTTSVVGDSACDKFSNTDVRVLSVFIWPEGRTISGEIRQTWGCRSDLIRQRIAAKLNKQ